MMKTLKPAIIAAAAFVALPAIACADERPASTAMAATAPELVTARELMSDEEWRAVREQMQSLETSEERRQFQEAQHAKMQARAAEQGSVLVQPAGECGNRHGQETTGHQGVGRNRPTFDDFDLNGDERISNDEFLSAHAERIAQRVAEGREMKNVGNASTFTDIDADEDGHLSRAEFADHQAAQHGSGACGGKH